MTTDDIRLDLNRLIEERKERLDTEISQCLQKLVEIRRCKDFILQEEIFYKQILSGSLKTKYETIWVIRCEHTCHGIYYQGIFSSLERARNFIPSHDLCIFCHYNTLACRVNYTVKSRDSSNVSYEQWDSLDSNPF